MESFSDLPIGEAVKKALAEMGFTTPTPVQAAAIPLVLNGGDLIVQAQTGTGKTAAFGIPLAETVQGAGVQAIILCPTRELALQATEELNRLGAGSGMQAVAVYGGASYGPQLKALRSGANVIVATPGRLLDHLDRGSFSPDGVRALVLDEADEMLNMGFLEEIEAVMERIPSERQTLLFSATMPEPIARLAQRFLRSPERIQVRGEGPGAAAALIEQRLVALSNHHKLDALVRILAVENPSGVLVFRETREGVDELANDLYRRGVAVEALHGGLAQVGREAVVANLRDGRTRVVVATDVAARGLDVERISHVVNYDCPPDPEVYVHRIGRTGRAGREGKSFLFVTPRERRRLRDIETLVRARIPFYDLPRDEVVRAAVHDRRGAWLAERLAGTDVTESLSVVDRLMAEGHDPRTLAAAALEAAAAANGLRMPELQPLPVPEREQPRGGRNYNERAPREDAPVDRAMFGPKAVIKLSVGLKAWVRPGDLVGAIANEADIPGKSIGEIRLDHWHSFVEVPAEAAEHVLKSIQGCRIRGVAVKATLAEGGMPPREARPQWAPQRRR